jgi:3'-phosphoadenosine 5'-phosphosulfate sulfotransferase (PAPS reductase)/FAD synthetase
MRVEGPAYISFSGGRTSGYMLRRALDACDGKLPSDVHVLFSNTGKEMPATLDFVRDAATSWGVQIHWIEYRLTADDEPTYGEVDYASASREGEPFQLYIEHVRRMTATKDREPYLPGPGNRFCTTELKVRVMKKWMLDRGYKHWTNIVGIRADEPKRWRKMNRNPPERWDIDLPLVDDGTTVNDVRVFWAMQPFDLGIKGDYEGNCDACHLKMPWKVAQIFRDYPERAAWWLEQERLTGKQFRGNGHSIEQLVQMSKLPIVRDSDELEIQCTACTD